VGPCAAGPSILNMCKVTFPILFWFEVGFTSEFLWKLSKLILIRFPAMKITLNLIALHSGSKIAK
jgi:hypothetical protein